MWIIESKEGPRAKWRRLPYSKLYNTQAEALEGARGFDPAGCDPDGVTLRVTRQMERSP